MPKYQTAVNVKNTGINLKPLRGFFNSNLDGANGFGVRLKTCVTPYNYSSLHLLKFAISHKTAHYDRFNTLNMILF